jgi:hypothetical protein
MILGAAFLAAILFVMFVATQFLDYIRELAPSNSSQGSVTAIPNGTGWQSSPQPLAGSSLALGGLTGFLVFFALAYSVIVILTGLGIYRGRGLAFSVAIVIFGLTTLVGSGWSILSLAIVVYCGLRKLGGFAGPRP